MLKYFAVTFDPANRAVRFSREGDSAVVVSSPRTVGLGFSRSGTGWQVVDVIPNTAAGAAGIQVGDVVLTINGKPVAEFDYNRWQSLLQSETSVTVEVLRGDGRQQAKLAVSDLVK